jgi:formyltetrahydrofolate-dependent phosphoribosylglycinamide formyltransferase
VQLDPIAILIGPKGRGSNMAALAKACADGSVPARVAVVIAPKEDIPAVETARSLGLMVEVITPEPLETYGSRLLDAIGADGSKWVCLAGFTRLLPKEVLAAYPNHVLNIHPALLPKYGGKGMYGIKVHEAVLGSDDQESGCTVHFVNEQYDDGAIILQRRVPRLPNDTPEELANRVLEQEHIAYAEALAKVINESRR